VGWDKGGRYYTRSKKVRGRVVREYVGTGRVAELAARMDELDRQQRRDDAREWREQKAELESLDDTLQELAELTDLLARAVLVAAGYRQHKRGEWRKRRAQDATGTPTRAPDSRGDRGTAEARGEGARGVSRSHKARVQSRHLASVDARRFSGAPDRYPVHHALH
jgi:hypothetical protein